MEQTLQLAQNALELELFVKRKTLHLVKLSLKGFVLIVMEPERKLKKNVQNVMATA